MRRNVYGKKLTGCTRPVTKVRFNSDGDILFASCVDKFIYSWRGDDSEPLGVFRGHTGAVYDLSVTDDTLRMLTASADCSVKIWDVETQNEMGTVETEGPCFHAQLSMTGDKFYTILTKSSELFLNVMEFKDNYPIICKFSYRGIPTCSIWGAMNDEILIGLESGELLVYNISDNKAKIIKGHSSELRDIQMSLDYLHFITCSTDNTVILWDSETFEQVLFDIGARLNSISISPFKNYFACGGGVKSSDFTTTKNSGVDIFFYDIKRKTSCGKIISPHSGPVNSLRIRNDGSGIASGAEDATINFYPFDESSILTL